MYNSRTYRTKRRRIQNELLALDSSSDDGLILNNSYKINYQNQHDDLSSMDEVHSNKSLNYTCHEEDSCVQLDNVQHVENVIEETKCMNKCGQYLHFDHQKNLKHAIGKWAVDFNVPQNAVTAFLKLLKCEPGLDILPKDCRTLLHNKSTKILNVRNMDSGAIYYHFGLSNGIKRSATIFSVAAKIKIAIGIDGLPLLKCSTSQFWPILAYIQPYHKFVFPVGIYHGQEKPQESNEFLQDFISEILDLTKNGIVINNSLKKVIIQIIYCDALDKSFILRTKGHSGFFSCTRCVHEGEYLENRVCFPYLENGSLSRTHDDYVSMINEEHHISSTISCISLIPDIDIVSLFSMDYMHLVCLSAMRKLILLWIKGPLSVRLPSWKVKQISLSLSNIKKMITNDFSRKPRSLEEINRWKATELRQFLLYTGIIVLKNELSDECYQHFLALNIAMRILLSANFSHYIKFAQKLLNYFVNKFQHLYGKQFISHNIHGLLHLADDYVNYGHLDRCSTFPFENYMKSHKAMLRKHKKQLHQVIKRYEEQCEIGNIKYKADNEFHFDSNKPNCFALTNQGEVIKIVEISHSNITGHIFTVKEDLYEMPIKSSKLNIFIVKQISNHLKQFKITDIKNKLLVFDFQNKQIVMPILHSN